MLGHQLVMNSFIVIVVFMFLLNILNVDGKPAINDSNQNPSIMCKLPAVKGHCRALLQRWRYNPATGKCEEFNFGGCDGNGNNFTSHKACMAICAGIS